MRLVAFSVAILCLCSSTVLSQGDPVSRFSARSHSFDGRTIPYRLFVPDGYQPSADYPVLLALHGSGERGTDNRVQLTAYRMATAWVDPSVQAKSPLFVVAPQCPPDRDWRYAYALLVDLLDSLGREFSLDSNRVYITGLSMGGFATFDLIMAYPGRFAAAIPMSAGGDTSFAHLIRDIPIWNFHGALDDVVPVGLSREMMQALEALGRRVINTHCHAYDCSGLSDSVLAMYVRSHADLLYTEYATGGHVIWDGAYTTPLLSTWLFDRYRQTPSVVRITSPGPLDDLAGVQDIRWEGGLPEDTVEIWFSPDAGEYWQLVSAAEANDGSFAWNTASVSDCAFGTLRVFLKNVEGRIYANDRSPAFAIDNPGNGVPFVHVSTPGVEPGQMLTGDSLFVRLLVADPEDSSLTIRLLYSTDGASSVVVADSFMAPSDTLPFTRSLTIGPLANSGRAFLTVEANDGISAGRRALPAFAKNTPRTEGPRPEHTAGGGGSVTVHYIDPAQLTGDLYRVTFHGSSFGAKSYDVTNVDRGALVVQGSSVMDGLSEGPIFDGVRLVVRDVMHGELDVPHTRWEEGAPSILNVVVSLPVIDLGGEVLRGFPQPADYDVEFSDQIVDTSSSAIGGLPEVPVNFSVHNATEGKASDFIFIDTDNSGAVTGGDEVYILEPDSLSNLRLTWALQFQSGTGRTAPQAGDRFALRTVKPITEQDVFEFRTVLVSVEDTPVPQMTALFPNYPNPFNPFTTIEYQVGGEQGAGRGVKLVRLVVYDILGRQIALLVNGNVLPGRYSARFDGSRFASGVYFCRLSVDGLVRTSTMLLLK